MLEFLFIILIFLEIAFTYWAIIKMLEINKKIIEINTIVLENGKLFNDMHKKIQTILKRVNFFMSIVTNKRLWQIKRAVSITINVIQLLIILKSFSFKKGVKFNLKNLRKLLFTNLSAEVLKRLFNRLALICQ